MILLFNALPFWAFEIEPYSALNCSEVLPPNNHAPDQAKYIKINYSHLCIYACARVYPYDTREK